MIDRVLERKEAVIVYGASSSVGAYVVQLARLAGYFVVGVAGSSADYAKSVGADAVVDYRKHSSPSELVCSCFSLSSRAVTDNWL